MDRNDIIAQLLDNRRTMKHGMHGYMAHLAKQLPVSRAQMELLFIIKNSQPIHSKQAAEQLGLTPGAVSQLLDSLLTKEFVKRIPDPHDRRLQSLHLTKKGDKLISGLEKQRHDLMDRIMSQLETDELAIWLRVQQKMIVEFEKEYNAQKKETK